MPKYGLIGYPLSHSFSKKYFTDKFDREKLVDSSYNLYSIQSIEELPELIKKERLNGLNVTIPHKEAVIPYLDELDETAMAIGAVNTIKIVWQADQYHLKGYNTDAIGFKQSLIPHLKTQHQEALILGTGGSAKAVAYVLQKLDIAYQMVSRTPRGNLLSYRDLNAEILHEHKLLINCTPLGMYPEVEAMPPLPLEGIDDEHLVYDLIYNPQQTKLLKEAAEKGATAINGLKMLELQAEASWEIWDN